MWATIPAPAPLDCDSIASQEMSSFTSIAEHGAIFPACADSIQACGSSSWPLSPQAVNPGRVDPHDPPTVRSGEWPAWFSFWFSGCWRALAKGTAWADFYCVIHHHRRVTKRGFTRPKQKPREMNLPLTQGQPRCPNPSEDSVAPDPGRPPVVAPGSLGRPAPRVAPGSTHGRSFGVRIKGAALQSRPNSRVGSGSLFRKLLLCLACFGSARGRHPPTERRGRPWVDFACRVLFLWILLLLLPPVSSRLKWMVGRPAVLHRPATAY